MEHAFVSVPEDDVPVDDLHEGVQEQAQDGQGEQDRVGGRGIQLEGEPLNEETEALLSGNEFADDRADKGQRDRGLEPGEGDGHGGWQSKSEELLCP